MYRLTWKNINGSNLRGKDGCVEIFRVSLDEHEFFCRRSGWVAAVLAQFCVDWYFDWYFICLFCAAFWGFCFFVYFIYAYSRHGYGSIIFSFVGQLGCGVTGMQPV